ncbi:MAG: adenylate kinase [Anaerolineales bacterium]
MLYVVLFGVPGAGKGTQAKRLSAALRLPHVSSGDLFREHVQKGTDLGIDARSYIDRGELVPDLVTIGMVRDRLAQPDAASGAILDGFPRTIPQADAFEVMAQALNATVGPAIHLQVPLERLIDRMAGRRVCRESGHVYHLAYNPPSQAGVCDHDGSELVQREDDQPETVRKRVQVYAKLTAPLIEFYRGRGVLEEVNGDQPMATVTAEILVILGQEAAR